MAKCTAITRGGERCKGIAIDNTGYCHAHHPDRATQRRRYASKGGRRGGRGRPSTELVALRAENGGLRQRMLDGELAPRLVAVAVQSINTDIRAIDAGIRAREQEELVERLESLEAALEARKPGGYTYGS